MITAIATSGPWRAAVALDSFGWGFPAVGWIEESAAVSDRAPRTVLTATVEIRLRWSGINPCALLGGTFTHQEIPSLSLRVARAGATLGVDASDAGSEGLLGQPLVKGIPDEFAAAVVRGLTSQVGLNRPGVLRVDKGGYDPVDSSRLAFERAAELLKWVLLANGSAGPSADDLATYLARWRSA